jgi:hypothetical protein
MLSPLRNRFGIPGVISVIALVFAMFGGAYAATNSGGSGKATASAKGKPGPRGPRGPKGPAGPTGPQGAAGANGKDGAQGAKGDAGQQGQQGQQGTQGNAGTNGKSVTLATEPEGANCEKGGTKVEIEGTPASKKYVCNGKPGAVGSPWTAGGTLPIGATETGTWSAAQELEQEEFPPGHASVSVVVPISFNIQLSDQLSSSNVHSFLDSNFSDFDESGPGTAGCTGSIGEPTAPIGHLCVYGEDFFGGLNALEIQKWSAVSGTGATPAGAALFLNFSGFSNPGGTWAVTGF